MIIRFIIITICVYYHIAKSQRLEIKLLGCLELQGKEVKCSNKKIHFVVTFTDFVFDYISKCNCANLILQTN